MGKIIVKAQQQKVWNKDNSGAAAYAYVLRAIRYSTMRAEDIVEYCAANSIVPKAYLRASMVALSQCIENFLLNGHSVEFPDLGIFFLTGNGVSETDATKAGIAQLDKLNIRFLPCSHLKTEVENVSLEYGGTYEIAGENAKGEKYYKKVDTNASAEDAASDSQEAGDSTTGDNATGSTNFTLTVNASPSNGGTVTGGGSYASGTQATLKAQAASGYAFSKWSDGDTNATRTVTVTEDKTYTATFVASGSSSGTSTGGSTGGDDLMG